MPFQFRRTGKKQLRQNRVISQAVCEPMEGRTLLSACAFGSGDVLAADSLAPAVFVPASPSAEKTTTKLAVSPKSPTLAQVVTLTATVTAKTGSPGGTVDFMEGSSLLGTGTVDTSTHIASLNISDLALGSNSIQADYLGASGFDTSKSSTAKVTVKAPPAVKTTTTLTSSENPALFGNAVTLTATVTSTGGSPDGTVTFVQSGATLGMVVINGSDQAALVISDLPIGADDILAVYTGAIGFAPSTSKSLKETINVNPALLSDLKVESTNISAFPPFGEDITVTDTIKNKGPADLGDTTLDYYLSPGDRLASTSVLIGSRDLGPLANGAESTGEATLDTSSAIADEPYFIILTDPQNAPGTIIASYPVVFFSI